MMQCQDVLQEQIVFSFGALVHRLAEGMPISINQGRTPSSLFNLVDNHVRLRGPHFFSSP